MTTDRGDDLLTPAEVAALFRVDAKTVTHWARNGKLSSVRTLGGHRRYRADEVRKLLEDSEQASPDGPGSERPREQGKTDRAPDKPPGIS
jgi:excisionase family DNA binding protein